MKPRNRPERLPAQPVWVDVPTSVRAHVRNFVAGYGDRVNAAVAMGIALDSLQRIQKSRPIHSTTLALVQRWLSARKDQA
jgi:hypothetical protein